MQIKQILPIIIFLFPICFTCQKSKETNSLENTIISVSKFVNSVLLKKDIPDENNLIHFLDTAEITCRKLCASATTQSETLAVLTAYIYDSLSIGFDSKSTSLASHFPYATVVNFKGSCVGVTLLFVILAKRLKVPLVGVAAPSHVFLRFVNKTSEYNLEPNRHGYKYSNDEYRSKYRIDKNSWYSLRPLSDKQMGALLWYNTGNIFMAQGMCNVAIRCYIKAEKLFPEFLESTGNKALCYATLGRVTKALTLLQKVANTRPDLKGVYTNMGMIYLSIKKIAEAKNAFLLDIKIDSSNAKARYGLALAQEQSNTNKEAKVK